jgi:hypothetical protein
MLTSFNTREFSLVLYLHVVQQNKFSETVAKHGHPTSDQIMC